MAQINTMLDYRPPLPSGSMRELEDEQESILYFLKN